ncbi:MAG: ATP-binding protein [Fusobacteriaceae bacterium]|jgi:AAA15 family ATPase/GTPase|nr:ATP-binding protein [Fusobacteriaceae bacterium]
MLIQFNFKNFKSFKDGAVLDMSATKISEYPLHVVSVGNEKILPAAAIFGANASGKSNVIEAFRYMSEYVAASFEFGGDSSNEKPGTRFPKPTPFLFEERSSKAESTFEVYFSDSAETGEKLYNYGFSLTKNGIVEEWLNCKSKSSRGTYKRIFYRENDQLDLVGIPRASQSNIEVALEKEVLVVSLGSKLKIPVLKQIRDWFLKNEFANFGEPFEIYILSRQLPKKFIQDKAVREKVIKFLSAFDDSIIDFKVEAVKSKNSQEDNHVRVDAVHKMIGNDKTATIPLGDESAGTLKLFSLYQLLQDVLEKGSVLLIDELNSRIHPLLARAFLITFLNPEINKNRAQLIFTTHDAWQIDGSGLRRDEIWFTEKNEEGVSTLFSLADFVDESGTKIRKDENYEKNYLLGKYGAIPTLRKFDMFGGEGGNEE